MHDGGPRSKKIRSEAGDITKSMVMWLILTRFHDHSGADLGEIMQRICHMVLHKLISKPKKAFLLSMDQKD